MGDAGTVLAPWPGRIAGGRWRDADGREQQLALTDAVNGNAIHGLLRTTAFTAIRLSPDAVRMAATVHPQAGYPFLIQVTVEYRVGADGLTVTHGFRNDGTGAAPVGVGAHPYVRLGDRDLDELSLLVEADDALVTDARRIPVGVVPAASLGFTGQPVRVPDLPDDVVLTGFHPEDGLVRHRLVDTPSGEGLEVWAEPAFGWLQIYAPTQFPSTQGVRRALALEPMTCAPNAFNSGEGLRRLGPGESWSASWGIRPLAASPL